MSSQEIILLDGALRDKVMLPLLLMVVLVGLGRHYTQLLLKSNTKIEPKDMNELRYKQTLMYSVRTRNNGGFINHDAFTRRNLHLTKKETGLLREKDLPGAANPMSNPMAMMDMMKGQMTFMIPNFAMMALVGYFFSGFVCLKVPFPMPSNRFKLMLQRGVDLTSLDVSYVSSLCLYFLVTFGLSGVFRLLLGENDLDNMQMQGMGGIPGMGAPGQMGFDASAAFKQEKSILGMYKHEWSQADIAEKQLLGDRYPAGVTLNREKLLDLTKMNTK